MEGTSSGRGSRIGHPNCKIPAHLLDMDTERSSWHLLVQADGIALLSGRLADILLKDLKRDTLFAEGLRKC